MKRLQFKIMSSGSRAEALEKWGYATVYEAVAAGNMDALRFLLAARASPTERVNGESPILLAVRKGDVASIKLLHSYGAGVNQTGPNASPLVGAIKSGSVDVVGVLLDLGSYSNAHDKFGYSLLMLAARCGDEKIVSLLLSRGAEVNARGAGGCSALFEGVCGGSLGVVRKLVGAGANLYARGSDGRTPLMVAESLVVRGEGGGKMEEIVRYLRSSGKDADKLDEHGDTPLLSAIRRGDFEVAKALVCEGADCKARDSHGWTPLHLVSKVGEEPSVDPEDARKYFNPPVPKSLGSNSLTWLLLWNGARINARNAYGATPLIVAAQNGHLSVVESLLEMAFLRGVRCEVDACDDYGCSALMYGSKNGHLGVVRFLLSKMAAVDLRNERARVPHSVIRVKKINSARDLRARTARVETGVDVGMTALMYGSRHGHLEVVKLLLDHKADVNARDIFGRSVLLHSVCGKYCNLATLKLLLSRGADVSTRDMEGSSVLLFAVVGGKLDILEYLIEALMRYSKISPIIPAPAKPPTSFPLRGSFSSSRSDEEQKHHSADLTVLQPHQDVCSWRKYADARQTSWSPPSSLRDDGEKREGEPSRLPDLEAEGGKVCRDGIEGDKSDGSSSSSDAVIPKPTGSALPLSASLTKTVATAPIASAGQLSWSPPSSQSDDGEKRGESPTSPRKEGFDVRTCGASANASGAGEQKHPAPQGGSMCAGGEEIDIVNDWNKYRFTVLMVAAQRGNLKLTRFLVERGADVNLQEEFGRSALFFAVEGGHFHVAEFLLKRGASVNVTDEYTRETPLSIARSQGRSDIVELLCKHGATK